MEIYGGRIQFVDPPIHSCETLVSQKKETEEDEVEYVACPAAKR